MDEKEIAKKWFNIGWKESWDYHKWMDSYDEPDDDDFNMAREENND